MSDLLKQAIADAKAVRATALANAKAALEEAFTPKIQSMLAEKLKQEVEGEAELPAAEPAPAAPAVDVAPEAHADAAQDAAMAAAPAIEELGHEEEEIDEDAIRGTTAAELDPTLATTNIQEADKASSDYKKKTAGHKTEDPQGASNELKKSGYDKDTASLHKTESHSTKASSDYKKETSGHKTEDPQGASNELTKSGYDKDTASLKEGDEEIDEASLDEILKELEASVNESGVEETSAPEAGHEEVDEEINLDELLSEGGEEEEEIEEGKLPAGLAKYQKEKAEKHSDDKKEKTDESIVQENISLKKENEEYRSAISYLRDQINEVNLLNAKLLYTNKLFKQGNFSNEQKLKIIESFDLTKSVREAKLVYATLAESLNNSAKKVVEAPKKEVSQTVKTITEGLASKSVASTKPTKAAVLNEGADLANRFKKLAGIRS